jgi:GT2 family glycosyltransferase
VLRHPGEFNYPDLVNAGAGAARGDVLVLLNNDCVARDHSWLDAMTSLAREAEVGAVGAILLYEDGSLQHAGVTLGLGGEAGHRDRKLPAAHVGNLGRLSAVHEVSAVTAACLAVERRKYHEVGGVDRAFAVAFNDIDFCLRLQERGYRNLLTPEAVLIHAESASRGQDTGPKRARFEREAARFRDRWRPLIQDDPYFHPLFSTTRFNDRLG